MERSTNQKQEIDTTPPPTPSGRKKEKKGKKFPQSK